MINKRISSINNIRPDSRDIIRNDKSYNPSQTPLQPSLEKGQVLNGRVVSTEDGQIKMVLDDGQIINGSLIDNAGLSAGMDGTFQVDEITNNSIVLKLLNKEKEEASHPLTKNDLVNKILDNWNMLRNDRNTEIVKALLDQQMPVDKETIIFFLKQSHIHEDIPVDTLIRMKNLQMPLTDENISKFDSLLSTKNSLANKFNSLINNAVNSFTNKENISTSDFLNKNLTLLETFHSDNNLANHPLSEVLSRADYSVLINSTKNLWVRVLDNNYYFSDSEQANHTNGLITKEKLQEILLDYSRINTNTQPFARQNEIPLNKVLADIINIFKIFLDNEDNPFNTTSHHVYLHQTFESDLNNYLSSLPFQNLLKGLFADNYYPSADALQSNESVEDYLISTMLDLKRFENIVKNVENYNYESDSIKDNDSANLSGIGRHLAGLNLELNQINEQFDTMIQLNKYIPFLHIPIKLIEQNKQGELYVFTKKNKNNLKSLNSMKVLIKLDMDNLGPVDIQISLRQNHVHTKFLIENKSSFKVIYDNISKLDKLLEDKGFATNTEVEIMEDKESNINDLLDLSDNSSSLLSYNFDTKV